MQKSRQGSMATVRLQRRAMLAEKLRDIYELDDIEEVHAGQYTAHLLSLVAHQPLEMPCWLLRSICRFFSLSASSTYPHNSATRLHVSH